MGLSLKMGSKCLLLIGLSLLLVAVDCAANDPKVKMFINQTKICTFFNVSLVK